MTCWRQKALEMFFQELKVLKKVPSVLFIDKEMESACIARQTTWRVIQFKMNNQDEPHNYYV